MMMSEPHDEDDESLGSRLARECAKLDVAEEQAMSDEVYAGECHVKPAAERELSRRQRDRSGRL